jgi:hypothetical protein
MTINRTLREVEDLMVALVRLTLNIPADADGIRMAYGAGSKTGSAAVHNPENSMIYVYVNPTDDGYGQQHHLSYINGENVLDENGNELLDADGNNVTYEMTEVDEYTEQYAVNFSLYGQDAYDRARTLRDGVYGVAVKEFLWGTHIHQKVGLPALVQTHELINTIWVKRCDVNVVFYAKVRIERENAVKNIESVSIEFKHEPI